MVVVNRRHCDLSLAWWGDGGDDQLSEQQSELWLLGCLP